jgi:hypothetical protein
MLNYNCNYFFFHIWHYKYQFKTMSSTQFLPPAVLLVGGIALEN